MRYLILLLAAAAILPACAPADSSPTAVTVTTEQFQQLRWIVGKWRGAEEAGGAPFFESYRMVDDSTIAQANLSTDPSLISLRKGRVTNGSAVATKWAASSVHFEPNDPKANSYTWRMENADRWTARLFWKDKSGEAHERVYVMTRVPE